MDASIARISSHLSLQFTKFKTYLICLGEWVCNIYSGEQKIAALISLFCGFNFFPSSPDLNHKSLNWWSRDGIGKLHISSSAAWCIACDHEHEPMPRRLAPAPPPSPFTPFQFVQRLFCIKSNQINTDKWASWKLQRIISRVTISKRGHNSSIETIK